MSDTIRAALEQAAKAVLHNLSDRKGIGNELDQCDDEVKAEIGRTVATKAMQAFFFEIAKKPNPFAFYSVVTPADWVVAIGAAIDDLSPSEEIIRSDRDAWRDH